MLLLIKNFFFNLFKILVILTKFGGYQILALDFLLLFI
jgi:hypothetical protein